MATAKELGLPRLRKDRPALICMNCQRAYEPTARASKNTDGKQSWCDPCRHSARQSVKARKIDDAREAAIEAKEAREVLTLMHERGRHDEAPNDRCPVCAVPS